MITKDDIESLLNALGFTKDLSGSVWCKDFPIGCSLEVDVQGERFFYQKAGIDEGARTTANFSQFLTASSIASTGKGL